MGEIKLTGEGDKEKAGAKEGAVQAESTTSVKVQDLEKLRAWTNHTQHARSTEKGGGVGGSECWAVGADKSCRTLQAKARRLTVVLNARQNHRRT